MTAAFLKKHLANCVTALRIPLSVWLALTVPFSTLFWALYLFCGATDLIDGWIARALQQENESGARLDSIADAAFAVAILSAVLRAMRLPKWLWCAIALIFCIRMAGYAVGRYKYHAFSSLHTVLNKLTGAAIFLFPLLYHLLGLPLAGAAVSLVAFASAVEELILTLRNPSLIRNQKGLFFHG